MRSSVVLCLTALLSVKSIAGTYRDLAMDFIKAHRIGEDAVTCSSTTVDMVDGVVAEYDMLTNFVRRVVQWRQEEARRMLPSNFKYDMPRQYGSRIDEARIRLDVANLRNLQFSVGEAVARASGGSSVAYVPGMAVNGVLSSAIAKWLGLKDDSALSPEGNMHAFALRRLIEKLDVVSGSYDIQWFSAHSRNNVITVTNGFATAELTLTPAFPQYRKMCNFIEDAFSDIADENGVKTVRVEEYLTPYELSRAAQKAYEAECSRLSKQPGGPRFTYFSNMKKSLKYPRFRTIEYKISELDFKVVCQWIERARATQPHGVSLICVDEEMDPSESGRKFTKLGVLRSPGNGGRILPLSCDDGTLVFGLPRGPHGEEFAGDVGNDNSVVLPCSVKVDDIDTDRYKPQILSLL